MKNKKRKRSFQRKSKGYLKSGSYDLDLPISLRKSQGFSFQSTSTSTTFSKTKTSTSQRRGRYEELNCLVRRLQHFGYTTIALSHGVHGPVSDDQDHADQVIDLKIIFDEFQSNQEKGAAKEKKLKLIKNSNSTGTTNPRNLKILKRLNVILDKESDLSYFLQDNITARTKTLLSSYDIIAFSPKNESILHAICNTQTLFFVDVITLDYTMGRGGIQLPYQIKSKYIQKAISRGVTFELPYAQALLDRSKCIAFVQSARQFFNASQSISSPKPGLIMSSGRRILNGTDHGPLTIRSPEDMKNLFSTLVDIKDRYVHKMFGEYPEAIVERGMNRRYGTSCSTDGSLTYRIIQNQTEVEQISPSECSSSSVEAIQSQKCDEGSEKDDEDFLELK